MFMVILLKGNLSLYYLILLWHHVWGTVQHKFHSIWAILLCLVLNGANKNISKSFLWTCSFLGGLQMSIIYLLMYIWHFLSRRYLLAISTPVPTLVTHSLASTSLMSPKALECMEAITYFLPLWVPTFSFCPQDQPNIFGIPLFLIEFVYHPSIWIACVCCTPSWSSCLAQCQQSFLWGFEISCQHYHMTGLVDDVFSKCNSVFLLTVSPGC